MTRDKAIRLILGSTKNHFALFSRLPAVTGFEEIRVTDWTARKWCKRILQCSNDQILFALLPDCVKFFGGLGEERCTTVIQDYSESSELAGHKPDFLVGFGTCESNNLENPEYTQTVKCPCCKSILKVAIN